MGQTETPEAIIDASRLNLKNLLGDGLETLYHWRLTLRQVLWFRQLSKVAGIAE
jgi:hypothetical protein